MGEEACDRSECLKKALLQQSTNQSTNQPGARALKQARIASNLLLAGQHAHQGILETIAQCGTDNINDNPAQDCHAKHLQYPTGHSERAHKTLDTAGQTRDAIAKDSAQW